MSSSQDPMAGSNGPALFNAQLSTAIPAASDLQRGERYQNVGYVVLDARTQDALNKIVLYSYDIACQCNARRSRPGASK
ncbi:hypothetical protein C8F04DRAFT_1258006 [Mycena alexandri]|uniref:Uncharacterized protein n=1 Tax=Mycena alexandri TaxID=1745969 RepID=A0AAD6X5N2_9AGAR|nr:hypothetical protein C8F04DRAFT_1258006 [Mycena alexandri]